MASTVLPTRRTTIAPDLNTLRRLTLPALWLALALQAIWMAGTLLPEPKDGELGPFDVIVVAMCGALAISMARLPWVATVTRMWIGVMLIGSVADRFGLLGEPGAAGVSWGSWSNFVTYTGDITTFLPRSLSSALAMAATVAEIVLGVGLLLGVRIPWMALGAAGLLAVYGLSMSISLGPTSTFPYNVWVLCTATLVLIWCDAPPISIDRLRHRRLAHN